MNAGNIAISFGYVRDSITIAFSATRLTMVSRLTLMGSNAGRNIADSGWQARIIETVLQNTFQIFDDD